MKQYTVPINPKLPKNFNDTPNDARPASHQRWWYRPYIQLDASGVRYTVYCLDGGAWDRPTWKGSFKKRNDAEACARDLWSAYAEFRALEEKIGGVI